jgi:uncharacterized membrane protein YbhN (UPF0104 family)
MLDRTRALADRLCNRYARLSNQPAYRIILGTLSLGIVAACVWFIWRQVAGGYATVATASLRLEPQRLVISWICTAAATALGAWAWVLLVRALGGQLDLAQGMSIHLTSNLVKYVPGFIWAYAGKGILAVRQGVPASVATLSIAAEFAIVYICGAVLALLALPFSGIIRLPPGGRTALQLAGIGTAGLLMIGLPRLAHRLAFQPKTARALLKPFSNARWSRIAFVMVAVLMTWCLLAFGFSILYGQPSNNGWSYLLRHSVALVGALLLGQIAFFAPTGVGVREAVLVALLATDGNAADVLILAVVFRLEMILGEIVCAIFAVAAVRIQRARQTHS